MPGVIIHAFHYHRSYVGVVVLIIALTVLGLSTPESPTTTNMLRIPAFLFLGYCWLTAHRKSWHDKPPGFEAVSRRRRIVLALITIAMMAMTVALAGTHLHWAILPLLYAIFVPRGLVIWREYQAIARP